MRHLSSWPLVPAYLLLTAFVFMVPSYADTQSVSGCSGCSGYTFSATLTPLGGNQYSLSYTITNVSGSPAYVNNWSLTLFASGNTVSGFSNFSMSDGNAGAYTVVAGKSNNGNANCNATLSDAVCVKPSGSGTLSQLGVGQSLTFTFDISCASCTELTNWTFLAQGNCTSGSGNCYAISTTGAVPEPTSLALLLGSGLVGLPFLRRKRRLKQPWPT